MTDEPVIRRSAADLLIRELTAAHKRMDAIGYPSAAAMPPTDDRPEA